MVAGKTLVLLALTIWVFSCLGSFLIAWTRPQVHEMQNLSRNTMCRLQKCCLDRGATYWATYGTLLGAEREADMIKWDDDIDVGMTCTDFNLIEGHLHSFGLRSVSSMPLFGNIRKNSRYVKIVMTDEASKNFVWKDDIVRMCCSVDVFLFQDKGDYVECGFEKGLTFQKTDLEDLVVRPFGTRIERGEIHQMSVLCPRNADRYLTWAFGTDWRRAIVSKTHYELVTDYSILACGVLGLIVSVALIVYFVAH
jgi:hypothetical protein